MKTMRRFSILMAMLAIAFSCTLTSWGDEEDPVVDDPQATLKIKVTYFVDLADTWYQFYNVEMTSTSASGKSETAVIQEDQEKNMTFSLNEAPDKVVLTVIAKPKTNHPEVVDGTVYSLDYSTNLRVVTLTEDGKESGILYTSPFSTTLSSGGEAFKKALLKERTLCNASYTIKK
jgi:hypothetical protein